MEFETILYERRERTACITLNRPDKLNAIDHTMIRELGEAYRAAETDEEVWTLIVTGAGRALCSGADVATVEQPKPGMDTRGEPLLGSYWQWNASAEATLGRLIAAHLGRGGLALAATHRPLPVAPTATLTLGGAS